MPLLPFNPPTKVAVDVFNWLEVTQRFGEVPIEGVYRHAKALSSIYWPFYSLAEGEQDFNQATVARLSAYLGKEIVCTRTPERLHNLGVNCWISLGLNFSAPWLDRPMPFRKICILHDLIGVDGELGPAVKRAIFFGMAANDGFAYISTFALHCFSKFLPALHRAKTDFIEYGCFHTFDASKLLGENIVGARESDLALSVSTVSPRKQIALGRRVTQALKLRHQHVGRILDIPEDEIMRLSMQDGLVFLGPVSDRILGALYQKSGVFICSSREEGFSMPALEAILHGCNHVLLSDIPAHREVYGKVNATFFDPEGAVLPSFHYTITPAQRQLMFERYKFETVSADLRQYIDQI